MKTNVTQADVKRVFGQHQVRYEVRPYYALFDQYPPGAPAVQHRIHAGFDVDLYGTLDKWQMPRLLKEEGEIVIGYFEEIGREVQSQVGQGCTIDVISYPDSLVLDTHLQPQATIRIRISHSRGVDQTEGPAEERALEAIRGRLHELEVKES